MKHIALFVLFLLAHICTKAQGVNKEYDCVLAKKLHADAYGMKMYYLVILKTGTANITDKVANDSIFAGHMNNIQRLASESKLVIAGPIGKNDKTYRGIFILNTSIREEAEKIVATDPAVQAKIFDAEFYPWYATAALQETFGIHKKLQK